MNVSNRTNEQRITKLAWSSLYLHIIFLGKKNCTQETEGSGMMNHINFLYAVCVCVFINS